jgi:hypothetical protein
VLRKKLAVLLAAAMMVLGVMSVPPAMATACGGTNCGNKANDGGDVNNGGGQEHIRNAHPVHGGGSGGDNGGGND